MKKTNLYLGLFSLLSLTACDTEYALRTMTGIRPDQVVDGPRRQPVLNRKMQMEMAKKAATQPMGSGVAGDNLQQGQMDYATPVQDESWAGSAMRWVGLGGDEQPEPASAPVQQIQPERIEPVVVAQPVATVTETNLPSPMVDAPVATEANIAPIATPSSTAPIATTSPINDDASRRVLSDNPYYSPWSSIEPQPLSSVPEKPVRLDEIKKSHSENIDKLQSEKIVAEQDKTALDNEVKSEANLSTTVPLVKEPLANSSSSEPKLLATKSSPTDLTTPPVSEMAIEPTTVPVASLPEVNVAAPTSNEPIASSKAEDAIVATSEPMNVDGEKKATTQPSSGFTPATALFNEDDLPSTNKIKTMRPSRYESRIRPNSYN